MPDHGESHAIERSRRMRPPRELAMLSFAVFAAPAAWVIAMTAGYALVTVACEVSSALALHLLALATLVLALAGGVVARRVWIRAGREWPGEGGEPIVTSRLLAVVGLMSSGVFSLVIVGQWLAVIVLHPCMGV